MDFSSEMVYPLVPLFLSSVLGVQKSVIGLIEGIAESTASLLKVFSGWLSDRLGRRKWLMAIGYGISTLSRPLVATAPNWGQVLASRFMDRFGKGVRNAPRDALIAESCETPTLGRSFGFHRGMDTVGAVIGPAVAFGLLAYFNGQYRLVFCKSSLLFFTQPRTGTRTNTEHRRRDVLPICTNYSDAAHTYSWRFLR